MTWYEALILGLVQGVGEFLPISSSGHLLLARELMGITGDFLTFDIMLHVATLFAIFIVFFKELFALFKPPFKTIGLIIIASVPAVVAGLVFSLLDIEIFESAKYLCFFFLISAIIMMSAEIIGKRVKNTQEIGLKQSICMGLMQAVAVLPGVTRSGSTIFGGIMSKGERKAVAKFSFFMSIPIILGAAVFDLLGGTGDGVKVEFYCYIIGMAAAFLSGFFAIKFMLKLIAKANFKWFALYLFVLSIVTFFVYFL